MRVVNMLIFAKSQEPRAKSQEPRTRLFNLFSVVDLRRVV